MTSLKTEIINKIIEIEGGYVYDSQDSGGETKFGITKRVAINYGYDGEMSKLPHSLAFEIYSKKYWDSLLLDKVQDVAPMTTEKLADISINMGVGRASTFLQRILNVLNQNQKFYSDITVDGAVGNQTLFALNQFMKIRTHDGDKTIHKMLNCLQGEFYISLAERRPKDQKFIFGWIKNRIS